MVRLKLVSRRSSPPRRGPCVSTTPITPVARRHPRRPLRPRRTATKKTKTHPLEQTMDSIRETKRGLFSRTPLVNSLFHWTSLPMIHGHIRGGGQAKSSADQTRALTRAGARYANIDTRPADRRPFGAFNSPEAFKKDKKQRTRRRRRQQQQQTGPVYIPACQRLPKTDCTIQTFISQGIKLIKRRQDGHNDQRASGGQEESDEEVIEEET